VKKRNEKTERSTFEKNVNTYMSAQLFMLFMMCVAITVLEKYNHLEQ